MVIECYAATPKSSIKNLSAPPLLHLSGFYANIWAVKLLNHTAVLLLAAAILLPGTGCSWSKRFKSAPAADTRPEPKLKRNSYTVNGRRYRPMTIEQALQYREVGEASLYEGANTRGALGEKIPYGGMYAAHRTLPLPSTVRITSISTGKSCLVRVNDRGPFHRRRIIDISPAVARAIGFHQWGVHQVEIETVSVGDGPNQRRNED